MNEFKNKGLSFITELANKNGHDLIYSLALEAGNVFVIVAAHPSMTKKRWTTENERLMFLIDESEYEMNQDELINDLTKRIEAHMYYVGDKNEA